MDMVPKLIEALQSAQCGRLRKIKMVCYKNITNMSFLYPITLQRLYTGFQRIKSLKKIIVLKIIFIPVE